MNYKLTEDKILYLYPEGRLDANRVPDTFEGIQEIIDSTDFNTLVLDFGDVTYISSVGLRAIIKLHKQHQVIITAVASNVYDIFDIAGFTQLIDIKRALPKIELKNATLIGSGFFSKVYRTDDETIVKVFVRDTSIEDIEHEQARAKAAFICGIPTAITYGLVEADDKYGVVFESLNGGTLTELINRFPEELEHYIDAYASLLKEINGTEIKESNGIFKDMSEYTMQKLEIIKPYLADMEYCKMSQLLEKLKKTNTYIHSDCHTGNIMYQDGEYFIIDMETLCVGNPIFELAAIYCSYVVFDDFEPGNDERFLHLSSELARKIYYDTIRKYLGNPSDETYEDDLNKIKLLGYLHILFWNLTYKPEDMEFFKFNYAKFQKQLDKVEDLNLVSIQI